MRIEDTAGNIYIRPENCDCGLTGGCEKCRGIYLPKSNNYDNRLTPAPSFTYHYNPFLLDLTEKGLLDIKEGRIHKILNIRKAKT